MKKLSLIICTGLFLMSCATTHTPVEKANPNGFQLQGHVKDLKSRKIYLSYRNASGKKVVDSTQVKSGDFGFSGQVNNPTGARLSTKDHSVAKVIYLENTSMKVQGSVDDLTVTGSKTEKENEALENATADLTQKRKKLVAEYREAAKNKDKEKMEAIKKKVQKLSKKSRSITKSFISDHPDSFISLYKLRRMANGMEYASLQKKYNNFSDAIKNSEPGQAFAQHLQKMSKTAVGQVAPDFTQKDVDGNPVSLSDFRGQYVLVDFWASWCGPCRAENPNVVKAYNEYKDDGFTVLGVSLDKSRDNWLKAIKDDNLMWTQVSDLKFWKNEVAQKYGIRAIPANYLISPKGVIVATDLRGDALEKKLDEIFN